MTEKYCKKCGVLIEKSWSCYPRRLYCLWHTKNDKKDRHIYKPTIGERTETKERIVELIGINIDKASVEEDRQQRVSSGEMRQRWLQEYIEMHRY